MYKPKFNYSPLSRNNVGSKRHYLTPDGQNLPSVTTILDSTKPEEKRRALAEWKARVGAEKAQAITTEAANRGTRMHTYLERYVVDGERIEMPSNPFAKPSWFMANQVIEKGLVNCNEYWGVEVPLYNPSLYAGTTDCVGVHNGQASIIDFKQSNKVKKREWIEDYFLQLCAYAEAHNHVHGTNIERGVIMMCVKPEMNQDGLMSGKEPEYLEFILEGSEFAHYRNKWYDRVHEYYEKYR